MIGVRWWILFLALMAFSAIVLLVHGDMLGFGAWFWVIYALNRIFAQLDDEAKDAT